MTSSWVGLAVILATIGEWSEVKWYEYGFVGNDKDDVCDVGWVWIIMFNWITNTMRAFFFRKYKNNREIRIISDMAQEILMALLVGPLT